jgi:hypothetical protein
MIRRISLITAVVGCALVVGVPAAWGGSWHWGDSWHLDHGEQTIAVSPDRLERAVLARELSSRAGARKYPNVLERAVSAEQEGSGLGGPYRDAFERAALAGTSQPGVIADSHDRIAPSTPTTSASVASSGREVEWSQLGIGFGLGILLAFGLVLAARLTRFRPLTH